MIDKLKEERRPDSDNLKFSPGWTKIHSWVFLIIIAFGFFILGVQNRYHYLSPVGLGKAYRIDKLFGGIQEFDPHQGWIVAVLQPTAPPNAMSMLEPSSSGPQIPQVEPVNTPEKPHVVEKDEEASVAPISPKEEPSAVSEPKEVTAAPAVTSPSTSNTANTPIKEMSTEERFQAFKKVFPDFGQDEFQLASDDLYPDWKKRFAPNGTWAEFLVTYKDFIRWWNDAGNPAETGVKLWQEYLAARGKS
ncbi:MAG: hypothetical protein ACP5U1_05410 [Desulfomonilaceae bacterium]